MNIGDNIKYLRAQKGYSQEDLAKALGYKSYTTITKWESGISEPTLRTAHQIADFFRISINELCYNNLSSSLTLPQTGRGIKIPVLGKVVAGVPLEAIEDILDYEEIDPDLASTGEFFALQIQGNSMEPKFSEGDVVIVKKQSDVENGDIAVILINGNEATVKKIKKEEKGITLIGSNPVAFEPQFYNNEEIEELPVTILGRVIELRAKF